MVNMDPYKFVGALKEIPEMLYNIGEDYDQQDDHVYIRSLTDAFDPEASGCRVPQMHPEETVCITDY